MLENYKIGFLKKHRALGFYIQFKNVLI